LIVIAVIGTYMRNFVVPLSAFNYEYILHSHSHVAILGWVYSALYVGILHSYLDSNAFNEKKYVYLFWLTQFTIIGMLVTFAIQGYAAFSIAFSSLHIIFSYIFIFFFTRDSRKNLKNRFIHSSSLPYIYASLTFLFISSIGPWSLGILANQKMIGSVLYRDAIYFYLHFQYNGWFTFAVMGLILWLLEIKHIEINKRLFKIAFWLMFIPGFSSYLLSVSYETLPEYLTYIAFASGIVQLIGAAIYFIEILTNVNAITIGNNKTVKILFYLFLTSLVSKFILQAASGLNKSNHIIFINRDIVIGYIHLVMLGLITSGLFYLFISQGFLEINSLINRSGIVMFMLGFAVTEIFLFSQFLMEIIDFSVIPYRMILFIFSALILIGLLFFWFGQIYNKDFKQV
ncbi:MAG: hypothetical protein ACHQJ4_03170, partial [Ignavibacteria bacterium]